VHLLRAVCSQVSSTAACQVKSGEELMFSADAGTAASAPRTATAPDAATDG
jgi:hypothetical protein